MGLEIAIVLGYLGAAFILAYIGSQLNDSNPFFAAPKIFLFIAAIVLMVPMFNSSLHLIDYANETSSGLTNTTYGAVQADAENGFVSMQWILRIVMTLGFILLLWWAGVMIKKAIDKGREMSNRGFDGFEKI